MARSRHGRSRGEQTPTGSGLPSWAQRHLDEAGGGPATAAVPDLTGHRRAPATEPSRLRGWALAVVAVAAAATTVPLAISSLANDHSDDPLPKVDTYTAGAPGPLPADGSGGTVPGSRPAAPAPGSAGQDPATAGVLAAPPAAAAPVAAAPIVPGTAVPAAVVRSTPTVTPTPTTRATAPRSATPTTTTAEQGRSATKTTTKAPTSTSKPAPKPQAPASKAPSKQSGGLLSNTVRGVGNTVGGVTDAAGDALGGL